MEDLGLFHEDLEARQRFGFHLTTDSCVTQCKWLNLAEATLRCLHAGVNNSYPIRFRKERIMWNKTDRVLSTAFATKQKPNKHTQTITKAKLEGR